MQVDVISQAQDIARMAEGDEPVLEQMPVEGDFGFYNDVGDIWRWRNYLVNYHILPDAGGLDQQDARKMRDIELLQAIIAEERYHIRMRKRNER